MSTIETTVAGYLNLDPVDILSKNRRDELVKARHITWYFLNDQGETFNEIAVRYGIGGSGVRAGVGKVRKAILDTANYRNAYKNTVTMIKEVLQENGI